MSRRVWLFLYSTPNIVGAVFGLAGLGLFFTGVIKKYWLFIVVGVYVAGLLLTPKNKAVELTLQSELTVEDIRASVETLIAQIRPRVPKEIFAQVERIREAIFALLPTIVDVNSGDHAVYTVRQTALEYLPAALQHYLNLPTAFANLHPLKEGKTATTLLREQLELLATTMEDMVEDFHRNDAEQLLIHGRFLEERFHKANLFT